MQSVMALMEKLDQAKTNAEGSTVPAQQLLPSAAVAGQTDAAPSALPSGAGPEDMDDDLLDELAEAAAGGEEEADEDGTAKAQRVAAAKARLKAKRSELAKKMVLKRTVKP